LELVTGELYGAGLTDAGTPCACFRDHGMSADAPKSHCENTVFISVLTGLQLSECDWTIFYSSEQACGDETALVDVPARWESRDGDLDIIARRWATSESTLNPALESLGAW
jgi:hypothetical protein